MLFYGVTAAIAYAAGYATWQLVNLTKYIQTNNEADQESILPYPFGLSPQKVERLQKIGFYVGILSGTVLLMTAQTTMALVVFATCFIAGIVFKRVIELRLNWMRKDMIRELPIFLDTFLSMYQSGSKMKVAIKDGLVVTKQLPYAFRSVLYKWHDRDGPEVALESLRSMKISELTTCATMLTQVVRGAERSHEFLKEWKEQLSEMEHLNREARSAKKPILFTALLGLPFAASIVTWFYPFFIQAMHMFDSFRGVV